MPSDFEDFARAAAAAPRAPSPQPAPLSRVAVLGGGSDARLIAALALSQGCRTVLFSAYGRELEALRASSGISLRGAGPVGTYHVDGPAETSVQLTAELDAAVDGAEVIFLTGPVHKQRTYAMVLADHLRDGQILVVAPGRSLGAVETAWNLRLGGCTADVTICEVQGLPYWYRAEGAVLHLSEASVMGAACLPRARGAGTVQQVSHILGPLETLESVLASGFGDLSAAVEITALTLGGPGLEPGGVEVPMGGTPLPENHTFASLLGNDAHRLLDALAGERRAVAQAFGVRGLPETGDWVAQFSGAMRAEGSRPVPDKEAAQTLMRDGVIGSLAPLASAARLAGVPVPQTEALMAVCGALLGADVAAAGRRLESMGITSASADDARRVMDALMTGEA